MVDDEVNLRDYVAVARRRWRTLVLTVLVALAAVATYATVRPPVYEGTAEVLVAPQSSDTSGGPLQEQQVQSQKSIAVSQPVTSKVIKKLKLTMSPENLVTEHVTAEIVPETLVLQFTTTAGSPQLAARIANAYANGYLDYRKQQVMDARKAQQKDLRQEASALRKRIDKLDERISPEAGQTALEAERQSLLTQLGQVTAEMAALNDDSSSTGGGTVIQAAQPDDDPVAPAPLRDGALALVLGLLLGTGLAFVRDRYDDAVRDEDTLARALGDRPILGRIPHWSHLAKLGRGERLVTLVAPHTHPDEAYQTLGTNVRFLCAALRRDQKDREGGLSLVVTSAARGEGKTSTATNLAVAAARVGTRVVLVDADLRRPTVGERFRLGDTLGLSDLLVSGAPVAAHLTDVNVDNLVVLPAGTVPPNPAELLASPAVGEVLAELASRADLVIFDAPPTLPVADTLELARHGDLVLLVTRVGESRRRDVADAVERLERVGSPVTGAVFNDLDMGSGDDGYYFRPVNTTIASKGIARDRSRGRRRRAQVTQG